MRSGSGALSTWGTNLELLVERLILSTGLRYFASKKVIVLNPSMFISHLETENLRETKSLKTYNKLDESCRRM